MSRVLRRCERSVEGDPSSSGSARTTLPAETSRRIREVMEAVASFMMMGRLVLARLSQGVFYETDRK